MKPLRQLARQETSDVSSSSHVMMMWQRRRGRRRAAGWGRRTQRACALLRPPPRTSPKNWEPPSSIHRGAARMACKAMR
eukprot:scaffold13477_cov133-Skeletonema_marinoi.AAC.3